MTNTILQKYLHPREKKESYDLVIRTMADLDMPQQAMLDIITRYREPHRYYHNLDHIADILQQIEEVKGSLDSTEYRQIRFAAIFHDVVYQMYTGTDEEESTKVFMDYMRHYPKHIDLDVDMALEVVTLILATKDHKPITRLQSLLCKFDLYGFERGLATILSNEQKIRREYQWVDWDKYKHGRITKVLEKFANHELLSAFAKENISFEIRYLHWHTPNIAVYAGTFDPFHAGHQNILLKAEEIFDKVIIAVGKNPKKPDRQCDLHKCQFLKFRQIEYYDGLLTDYLAGKPYPVTLIRGLRNTDDMAYEMNQAFWLRQLQNDIRIVNIFCDPEFDNISSSALNVLKKYGNNAYQSFVVE